MPLIMLLPPAAILNHFTWKTPPGSSRYLSCEAHADVPQAQSFVSMTHIVVYQTIIIYLNNSFQEGVANVSNPSSQRLSCLSILRQARPQAMMVSQEYFLNEHWEIAIYTSCIWGGGFCQACASNNSEACRVIDS